MIRQTVLFGLCLYKCQNKQDVKPIATVENGLQKYLLYPGKSVL